MKRHLTYFLLCLLTSPFAIFAAPKATTTQIVAVVNKDAITAADLDNRVKFAAATSGSKIDLTMRQMVLQSLIWERLQLQAAHSKKILISEADIKEALEKVAKNNHMTTAQMKSMFSSKGVSIKTLEDSLHAQLAWVEYVRTQHSPRIQVAAKEIDQTMERLSAKGGENQYSYIEIFLNLDSPDQESSVLQKAQSLAQQLRSSTTPKMVAQEFSQSSSAARGGEIIGVSETQIDPALAKALKSANSEQVVGPVRVSNGYIVAKLVSRRFAGEGDPNEAEANLIQVGFMTSSQMPPEVQTQTQQAIEVLRSCRGCGEFRQKAQEMGAPISSSSVKMGTLPPAVADAIRKGGSGKCHVIPANQGVMVMMACDFKKSEYKMPSRQDVEQILQEEKIAKVAHRDRLRIQATAFIKINDPQLQTSLIKTTPN